MSCSFSAKAGSVESLKGRQRCGARPCVFQILSTVETASPETYAIARAVLASCGGGLASSRQWPWCGHPQPVPFQTFAFAVPVAAMMAFVPRPSALSSTIRARQTCFWAELRSPVALKQTTISIAECDGNPSAHTADSHTPPSDGIPFGTHPSRSYH